MNKNTKIWLNYLAGAAVSALLLWAIYAQAKTELDKFDFWVLCKTVDLPLFIAGILLMPLNLGIEAYKWKMLAGSAQPLSYFSSLKSVLAGLSISLLTPNRIGEYPGRILYLRKKNTLRLISVSILGACAQFFTLFIFGSIGLIAYNFSFPGISQKIILCVCLMFCFVIGILYFSFENWISWLERFKIFHKLKAYGHLLRKFTAREELTVLGLSMLRFLVLTAQYLILLRAMNIFLPVMEGFFTASLFFWSIAVVPSIALAELGVRGEISLFLFGHFSGNVIGILAATVCLWCINVAIPAVTGSILMTRMRLFK